MNPKLIALVLACVAFVVTQGAAADETRKPLVFGASGKIGGVIVDEALDRGHVVVGVSRNPERLAVVNDLFAAAAGDLRDRGSVAALIDDTEPDAVIVSVAGTAPGNRPEDSAQAVAARNLIDILGTMGPSAPRVIQVGGHTTLENSVLAMQEALEAMPFDAGPGTPRYAMFLGHWVALQLYRDSTIRWTVATPAQQIEPGTRTGAYRISAETAVADPQGHSHISTEDFAVAMMDEIDNPRFVGRRYTVGY